jgi:c-di-GMP-binding flagellar brake protein YcgR
MNEQSIRLDLVNTLSELRGSISAGYVTLLKTTRELQVQEAVVLEARLALSEARSKVLVDHADDIKALGTNEAVREANISKLVEKEKEALRFAEIDYTGCRNAHQIATIDVEALRALLRCLEATALVIGGA